MNADSLKEHPRGVAPVEWLDTGSVHDTGDPEPGIALCLSGGGYRSMLFHLGALWRLNEAGLLPRLARLSCVSAGAILGGMLGLHWAQLGFEESGVARRFETAIADPIRSLADRSIDAGAILGGALGPGSIGDQVVHAFRRRLFGDANLQDLPDEPRIVIVATNVGSGALWRFMKPYMRDYRVGEIRYPTTPLAVVVAASSARPPFLSPIPLTLEEEDYTPGSGQDLQKVPFTTDVFLTDGSVEDVLALETAWKRYGTVLIGDGGGEPPPEAEPKRDWARHTARALTLMEAHARARRKQQAVRAFRLRHELLDQGEDPESTRFRRETRAGAYWGVRSDLSNYGLDDALPCPVDATRALARIPTRMRRLERDTQERLVNWGYAVCDAALRRHYSPELAPPDSFPYPESGV